jgi:predicted ATPase
MKKNTLKSLQVRNLLSFGSDSPEIELGDLNVLIGPNGSGKSNLIEIIGLLRSAPKDIAGEVGDNGGVEEWLWKGKSKGGIPTATIHGKASPNGIKKTISYQLSFTRVGFQMMITDERIENERPDKGHKKPYRYFDLNRGHPILNVAGHPRSLKPEEVDAQRSILSQRQDPHQYPEVTCLGRFLNSFRLYRNWEFGRDSVVRDLYGAGQKNDYLEEDFSNLGLMLQKLRANPAVKGELLRHLKMFYAGAEDISTTTQGGLVDLRIEEEGGITIPASRLSDGTLRWLSLLTILLHPDPPPLVCIEEPELGLHPDMIQPLAKLLLRAAERMQLIITTHSDDLIDEMSGNPAAIIVCEKHHGSSVFRRLDAGQLSEWLERYRLGQLWRTGEIGGNRW